MRINLSAAAAKRHGRKTLRLRQIVRLCSDGHQTAILTSRFDLPAAEIAARQFNRWRQENYFRYGRTHFALDALDTYATIDDDPGRSVPNPAKRAARRKIRELERIVADAKATPGRHRNTPSLSGSLDELEATLAEVRGQLEAARQKAANTPRPTPAGRGRTPGTAAGHRNQAAHPCLSDRGLQHRVRTRPAARAPRRPRR